MINFTSMTPQQPIRPSRGRWRFDRGSGRRLFPLSDTLRAVQAAGDRNPGVVPLRCPVLSAASVAPEQRLMLAVLDDAFLTLARHGGAADRRGRSLTAEVDAWLAADDDDWPFSFVNVCHALRLDASSVRARVDRWRREAFGRATSPPSCVGDRRGREARVR